MDEDDFQSLFTREIQLNSLLLLGRAKRTLEPRFGGYTLTKGLPRLKDPCGEMGSMYSLWNLSYRVVGPQKPQVDPNQVKGMEFINQGCI